MWEKIKKWVMVALGAVISVLLFIVRGKNKKIKETERELEVAEQIIEVNEIIEKKEKKLEEISQTVEKKTEQKIEEIKAETDKKIDEIEEIELETIGLTAEDIELEEVQAKYNEMIREWNNER